MPVFLAVLNMEGDKPELIARNLERVLTARLRDARFFWDADREQPLERARRPAEHTFCFTRSSAATPRRPQRVSALARRVGARRARKCPTPRSGRALAGRLAKADLATDMVREMTELQGTMGGIYAREDGHPEEVWKAIYYHYLPVGVEADAPPSKDQLGGGRDDLGRRVAGGQARHRRRMFAAGERPDRLARPLRSAPCRARAGAHADGPAGADRPRSARDARASRWHGARPPFHPAETGWQSSLFDFLLERVRYVLEQRGFDVRNVRAVTSGDPRDLSPLQARRKLDVLPEFTESPDFKQLAVLFKRVRNIAKNLSRGSRSLHQQRRSIAPDRTGRSGAVGRDRRAPAGDRSRGELRSGVSASLWRGRQARSDRGEVLRRCPGDGRRCAVARRAAALMKRLEALILQLADVSEIVPEESK